MKMRQTGQPSAVPGARAGAQRFLVYNVTDGILAGPDLMTLAEARVFIRRFPRRFARQRFYLTASCDRIRPGDVELEIVEVGPDLAPDNASVSEPLQRGW